MARTRKRAQESRRLALASEFAGIARLISSLLDPYRPELHYMRGPGPKWQAKHRPAAAEAHHAPGLFRVKA